jgi:hypothetical protein
MAAVTNNPLIHGFRGAFGKTLVFKQINGKTFVSAFPRKPEKQKESAAQKNTRVTFRKASEWAQITLLDPKKKAYYQERARELKLPNAYTAAITDYMRKPKVVKTEVEDTTTYTVSKPGFLLRDVQVAVNRTDETFSVNVAVKQRKDFWIVTYPSDTSNVPLITLTITDLSRRHTIFSGAG